jgi:glucose dehydrogenase
VTSRNTEAGRPTGWKATPFLSPLGAPCLAPPWGRITAIDLKTRKVAWQRLFGTSRDTGLMGWRTGLPLAIGVPNTGGPITTASGMTFIAAAQDLYLRAVETRTGRELWRGRLPAGGQATPMTYISRRSGRQMVVISAGGHGGLDTQAGDYIVAYALRQ